MTYQEFVNTRIQELKHIFSNKYILSESENETDKFNMFCKENYMAYLYSYLRTPKKGDVDRVKLLHTAICEENLSLE